MKKLSDEEQQALQALRDAKGYLFDLLNELADNPDDVSMLPRLVVAMKVYRRCDCDKNTIIALRRKAELGKESIARTQGLSRELKDIKIIALAERTELLKTQADVDRLEKLARQGRKKAIVQIALASGDLQAITEDRIQEVVNSQRRSNGGVVRIESGSGK